MKAKIIDKELEMVPYYIRSLDLTVYGEKVGKNQIIYSPPGWLELPEEGDRLLFSSMFYLSLWKYEDEFVALCKADDFIRVREQVANQGWTVVIGVIPSQVEVILKAFDDVGFTMR